MSSTFTTRESTSSSPRLLRTLGNSDLGLTPLGLGTWAFGGGGWEYSQGPQDDKDSIAAIHCALDHGINWIDTAPVYGLGHAGDVVARALKSASKRPYLFTKCGIRWDKDGSTYNSLKADSLAEELESSLKRLGVDCIDLYQIHWPEPDHELEEGWEALSRFRDQGKVRWIGVSNFSVAQMKRVVHVAPITSIQPPYSLLNRSIEPRILPFAQSNGIGVISYSPLSTGILSGHVTHKSIAALAPGDYRRRNIHFQEPRLSLNLKLVETLREIGSGHGVSPGVVAIAWTLHQPAITGAITGGRNRREVDALAPALDFRLTQNEYETIGRFLNSIQWNLGRIYCKLASHPWFGEKRPLDSAYSSCQSIQTLTQ